MGRTLFGMDVIEDKGSNLLLVVTLQVIPRNRKSTKIEKDNRENGNVWGKGCHYCIQCLVPDIVILFCLYNHSQQLEGRVDETSISTGNPIQEEGNYYKKWLKETKGGGGLKPLSHQRHHKKLLGPCRRPILFGKLSSSQFDREEHHVNCCPYTKA